MDSLTGQLLIAIPELPDSNFYRSVVLLIEHGPDGAMGVILNRPTDVTLSEMWKQLDPEISVERDQDFVYVGGPVKGPILGLHEQSSFSDKEVIGGICLSMESQRLNELAQEDVRLKIFTGYSGWGPSQLEAEIESGGWFVTDAKATDVFQSADNLWKNLCERVGQDILSSIGINQSTKGDPNLN